MYGTRRHIGGKLAADWRQQKQNLICNISPSAGTDSLQLSTSGQIMDSLSVRPVITRNSGFRIAMCAFASCRLAGRYVYAISLIGIVANLHIDLVTTSWCGNNYYHCVLGCVQSQVVSFVYALWQHGICFSDWIFFLWNFFLLEDSSD